MSGLSLQQTLLQLGFTESDLKQAEQVATKNSQSIISALEKLEKVPEHKLLEVFSRALQVPFVALEARDISSEIARLVPKDIASKHKVIPIDKVGNNLIVAMANPQNLQVTELIRFRTGYFVKRVLASEKRIIEALQAQFGAQADFTSFQESAGTTSEIRENTDQRTAIDAPNDAAMDDKPIIKLVNQILLECANRKASDIHIEPYESFIRVRLRIDGVLQEIVRPPAVMKNALTARVKIMARLNIAETRLPQDGAINIIVGDRPVDFRVNCCPTIFGEKIVMRILDKSALQVDMMKLGFDKDDLRKFKESIHCPFGMVLVTGPTGSGKTTTLYSALADLNKTTDNIMTAEDPVEYNLEGINQVQMKPDIGMDFASALRAFLRQDPDVIMVGEIRDLETAEIGIKAALTGHMVLSTLHTNSAPETISRMLNMGVEPFNLVSALTCIVAQRLIRRICEKCKKVDDRVTPEVLINMGMDPNVARTTKAYIGAGCAACGNSGNKGRIAVHEVLKLTDPVREAIIKNLPAMELKKVAIAEGMRSLRQAGLSKLIDGIASAPEVVDVTAPDDAKHTEISEVA